MLLHQSKSALILVDMQEKLLPLVIEPEKLIKNCQWLLSLAAELDIPCLVSEQYPKGLGKTEQTLKALVTDYPHIEKVHFSCAADEGFQKQLDLLSRDQLILVGMETAICVQQTALELIGQGKDVFVVLDAVSGRHQYDSELAVARMRQKGVQIISKEMVFFEWLRYAGTQQFKSLSKKYL